MELEGIYKENGIERVYSCISVPTYGTKYGLEINALTLGGFINYLEKENKPGRIFPIGFINPHSYRGYYDSLAFEPAMGVPVCVTLELAKACMNKQFEGYKGGWFKMDEDTDIYCAYQGSGWAASITVLLLDSLLGKL